MFFFLCIYISQQAVSVVTIKGLLGKIILVSGGVG